MTDNADDRSGTQMGQACERLSVAQGEEHGALQFFRRDRLAYTHCGLRFRKNPDERFDIGTAVNIWNPLLFDYLNQWKRRLTVQVDVDDYAIPFAIRKCLLALLIAIGDFANDAAKVGEDLADPPSLHRFVFDDKKVVAC